MEKRTGVSERTKQKGKYFIFGLLNTGINYGVYEALALLAFKDEGQRWIATLISGAVSIFVGYFLHSKFTWKDREVSKKQLGRFFVWNVIMNLAVRPLLTLFFGLFGFLYKFAFNICQGLGLGFITYRFVESTGNYVLMTAVVMVINFLVYDRFVFKETKKRNKRSSSSDESSEKSED